LKSIISEDYRNNTVYADNHSRRPLQPAPNQQPNNYRKHGKPKNEKRWMKLEGFLELICVQCVVYMLILEQFEDLCC
jgi:hypothetical protein